MLGRTWSAGSSHRYGFNGYEVIDDIYTNNVVVDFIARGYDPRICRFFSMDPISFKHFWRSPYSFAANCPILYMDQLGMDINGGFSVENNSQQPVIIVGNGEITTQTRIITPWGTSTGYQFEPLVKGRDGGLLNTYVVLEPNQKFVTTVEVIDETTVTSMGVTVVTNKYRYSGKIIDMSDGSIVQDDVKMFDIDGIDLLPGQTITTPEGKILNENNALNNERGIGYVKYDSNGDDRGDDPIEVKFQSGELNSARAVAHLPPFPTNGSVISITGSTSLRLTVQTTDGPLNDPALKYPEIKH